MVRRRRGGGYFTILTPMPGAAQPTQRVAYRSAVRASRGRLPGPEVPARAAGVPHRAQRLPPRGQRLRGSRAHLRARPGQAGGRHAPRRRHRRLAGAAAADGRPGAVRAVDADRAPVPHLRVRLARAERVEPAQGRRRFRLPGLQLPQVGVGRAAQGADAQAGGRGPGGGLQADGRHQHAAGAGAGRQQMREGRTRGLVPHDGRHGRADAADRRHGRQPGQDPQRRWWTSRRTSSSTAPAWRPTSPSTGCWPTCSSIPGPAATRSGGWTSSAPSSCAARPAATGVIYASGAATLGGYFPGVDTFLGLQIAAQEITDDLARRGFCARIGPLRSTTQWLRWAAARQP